MRAAFLVALTCLSATGACFSAPAPMQFDIVKRAGSFEVSLTNPGIEAVSVPVYDPGNHSHSGYWLYLYDPRRKVLLPSEVMVQIYGPGSPPRLMSLSAGRSRSWTIPRDEFLRDFNTIPGCYYLVGKFRLRWQGRLFNSNVSKPIRVCVN